MVREGFMPAVWMSSDPGTLAAALGVGMVSVLADLDKGQRWLVLIGPLWGCPVCQ